MNRQKEFSVGRLVEFFDRVYVENLSMNFNTLLDYLCENGVTAVVGGVVVVAFLFVVYFFSSLWHIFFIFQCHPMLRQAISNNELLDKWARDSVSNTYLSIE